MVDMSDTAACAAKREGRAEPGDHVDFCRQSSMDDSYLVVNHPNSIPEAASVRRKAPAKPLRLQQHLTTSSLRVKWVEYQPDSASSDGDLVASVVSAHKDAFFKHQTDADRVSLLAYWIDGDFNTATDSLFGAKVQVSLSSKPLWYLAFKGQPSGHVKITHKSTTLFPDP